MNLRVQIAHPHVVLRQIVGEVLRHPLGEGRHQHPLLFAGPVTDLPKQIIHLAVGGPHLHDRIEHPGGPDHLLSHLIAAYLQLPVPRRGTHKHGLAGLRPKLFPLQRAIVRCTGQAEAMVNQNFLAGLVAVVHRLQLGAGHMAFIHDQEPIVGEIINQAFRG